MINFIEEMLGDQEGFQLKLDNELTKVWAKTTGTKWDQSNPTVKCEMLFQSSDPIQVFESVSY